MTLSRAAARMPAPTLSRLLLLQSLLALLWLLAFGAARLLEYAPHASLWFPPVAVSFAGFLVLGGRAWPPLLLACVIGTVLADLDYGLQSEPATLAASGLGFALAHCLPLAALAAALRRLGAGPGRSMLRLVSMFLIGGGIATVLTAALGVWVLSLTGLIAAGSGPALVVPWLIGDYAGLVALGPLTAVMLRALADRLQLPHGFVRRGETGARRDARGRRAFAVKLALLLGLTALVLLLAARWPGQPLVFVLFLAVIVQLWIVHTQHRLHALLAIAAFSSLLVLLTPLLGLDAHALALQFAMIALAANSYFGLAVPELYADNARLRLLLGRDPLTGAWSRASFEEHAGGGIDLARREQRPATLVMLDLDLLKAINDAAGHAAGDRALCLLVECCREALRPRDVIGRLSGDEFCLFLPDTDAAGATALVGRIRAALELASAPGPDEAPLPIRASFGIATLQRDDDGYAGLLARADQAMYAEKRERRDAAPD